MKLVNYNPLFGEVLEVLPLIQMCRHVMVEERTSLSQTKSQ